jgi:hypothetical protein
LKTVCVFLVLYLFFCTIWTYRLEAQSPRSVTTTSLVWYETIVTKRLSSSLSWYNEIGQRRINGTTPLSQQLFRTGLTLHQASFPRFTIGAAVFHHDLDTSGTFRVRPEYRLFQLFELSQTFGNTIADYRLRIEQRWTQHASGTSLEKGFGFNHRIGHRIRIRQPLNNTTIAARTCWLEGASEVMLNYGRQVELNMHDQTRVSVATGYMWTSKISTLVTAMMLYGQKPSGDVFFRQWTLRANVNFML